MPMPTNIHKDKVKGAKLFKFSGRRSVNDATRRFSGIRFRDWPMYGPPIKESKRKHRKKQDDIPEGLSNMMDSVLSDLLAQG
ncbi:hypothetical protein CYMTET_16066 [Cymbomonas tetramitiformis]|uniref:Uncharacterized protein n=1 Tax=Cymbomonas tetramitiformis TaxID=36881 RepID=A0AAE0L8D5_9CHLO|nr:hypothetical protein CYMTET_16066 [Cymbomonas tetramitiformis]